MEGSASPVTIDFPYHQLTDDKGAPATDVADSQAWGHNSQNSQVSLSVIYHKAISVIKNVSKEPALGLVIGVVGGAIVSIVIHGLKWILYGAALGTAGGVIAAGVLWLRSPHTDSSELQLLNQPQ